MEVIMYDVRNATRKRYSRVVQIEAGQSRINGRLVNVWSILISGGLFIGLPQRHYLIERITIESV